MKKIIIILLAIFPLVFSSCKKDDLKPGTLTGTLEGFMDKDTKVVYDPSNTNSPFSWQNGDPIKVYRKKNTGVENHGGRYIASLTDDISKALFTYSSLHSNDDDVTDDESYSGKYSAFYPHEIANEFERAHYTRAGAFDYVDITLPNSYNSNANGNLLKNPMFAESVSAQSKKLPFKHICGLLRLQLQKSNISIVSVKITAITPINGEFHLTSTDGIPSITYNETTTPDARKAITLTFPSPQDISSQKSFFLPLPQGDYTNLEIEITGSLGQTCVKTQQSGTLHISRAMYSTISLGEEDLEFTGAEIVGAIGGLFTVNKSTGKKVRFSQGNLQFLASPTPTWRFATNQYDVCPRANNTAASSTSTDSIDMFGWGTSGYSTTDYGPSYPYNISKTDIYGPASGGFDVNGDQNFDWGYNNAISNGGNTPGIWRTLTSSEWNVIIKTRTNAANLWAAAIVNGQRGLVLLPDAWPSTGEPTYRGTASGWLSGDNINSYTVEQWRVLEQDGAVFLPQCGWRNIKTSGPSVDEWNGSNYRGRYWLSTVSTSGSPYFAHFYASNSTHTITLNYSQQQYKWHGYNVRLVCDVE